MEGEEVEGYGQSWPRTWEKRKQLISNAAAEKLEVASTNKRGHLFGYQKSGRDIPRTSVRGLQLIGEKES